MKTVNSQYHLNQNRLRHKADDMACARLRSRGISDPRLIFGHTYDEIRAYDELMASTICECMKELLSSKSPAPIEPKQTWADVAYS